MQYAIVNSKTVIQRFLYLMETMVLDLIRDGVHPNCDRIQASMGDIMNNDKDFDMILLLKHAFYQKSSFLLSVHLRNGDRAFLLLTVVQFLLLVILKPSTLIKGCG